MSRPIYLASVDMFDEASSDAAPGRSLLRSSVFEDFWPDPPLPPPEPETEPEATGGPPSRSALAVDVPSRPAWLSSPDRVAIEAEPSPESLPAGAAGRLAVFPS